MNLLLTPGAVEFILILFGIAIVVAVIAAIFTIVKSWRPSNSRIIWIALLVFPYTAPLTVIVFWIVHFSSQKNRTKPNL